MQTCIFVASHTSLLVHKNSLCNDQFKPICPHGRFLSTAIVHMGLLIHKEAFFPLPQPIQANLSAQSCSFHWHSPHRITHLHRRFLSFAAAYTGQHYLFITHAGLLVQTDHLLLLQQSTRDLSVLVWSPNKNTRK